MLLYVSTLTNINMCGCESLKFICMSSCDGDIDLSVWVMSGSLWNAHDKIRGLSACESAGGPGSICVCEIINKFDWFVSRQTAHVLPTATDLLNVNVKKNIVVDVSVVRSFKRPPSWLVDNDVCVDGVIRHYHMNRIQQHLSFCTVNFVSVVNLSEIQY